jgi:hypothetical protein
MELATLILSMVLEIGKAIGAALKGGDWSVLDRPVKELLPDELAVTVARKRAEAEAEAKFGGA